MIRTVLSIDDGGVCVVTLNRPARLNAINPELLDGLNTALARADADDRIGAIVLTGAGRAFCAGDDLVEQRSMLDADEATITAFVDAIQQVTRHLVFGDTPGSRGGARLGGRGCVLVADQLRLLGVVGRREGILPGAEDRALSERGGHLPAAVAGRSLRSRGRCSTRRASTRQRNSSIARWQAKSSPDTGCSMPRSRGHGRWRPCPRRHDAH